MRKGASLGRLNSDETVASAKTANNAPNAIGVDGKRAAKWEASPAIPVTETDGTLLHKIQAPQFQDACLVSSHDLRACLTRATRKLKNKLKSFNHSILRQEKNQDQSIWPTPC
ncbi:hypothetical protein GCM10023156_55450 [Novipirellula rosea]|uniref:Uncharacterized protein n=1 Tax=Novipirellula rosea TaxID=1031540 RepID=A0ABP8NIS2_9BACT